MNHEHQHSWINMELSRRTSCQYLKFSQPAWCLQTSHSTSIIYTSVQTSYWRALTSTGFQVGLKTWSTTKLTADRGVKYKWRITHMGYRSAAAQRLNRERPQLCLWYLNPCCDIGDPMSTQPLHASAWINIRYNRSFVRMHLRGIGPTDGGWSWTQSSRISKRCECIHLSRHVWILYNSRV